MPEDIDDPALWERTNRLLQAYADRLDRADASGIAALFTEDGCWDHSPDMRVRGRAAILAQLQQGLGEFEHAHHQVGPALLARRPDGGLGSTAYFTATHQLRGGERYTVWGRYVDRLVTGPELLFAERQTIVHLTAGTPHGYRMLARVPLPD